MTNAGEIAVGIDLGTSNSCVAAVIDGQPRVLADATGRKIHASVVSFPDDHHVIVGSEAKPRIITHSKETVWSAKRMIGRFFTSEDVQRAIKRYPYDITQGPNNDVRIKVRERELTPQEIGAYVIKKMKTVAEEALRRPVTKAVVTVPAYFNDNQRQATRDAGEIAGLEVLRIINEPTAAALSYGYGKQLTQRVAVYDFGGGTFDVSLLELGGDIYEVIATAGDTYLGGDDIDSRIVTFLTDTFHEMHGIDLWMHREVLPVLTEAAEDAKIRLASEGSVEFTLLDLCEDGEGKSLDLEATLTNADLAKMTMDLMQRTFKVCDEALHAANRTVTDLDGVIMVGGPTRLPFLREAVGRYFYMEADSSVDPDEVVALGAALQANALLQSTSNTVLLDVTPLTLRVGTVSGYSEEIIEKNTPVPIERSKVFTTVRDDQEKVIVTVLQGESRLQSDCELLGEFEFSDLRQAPRGDVKIEVTFEIDANGIVNVSALEVDTGRVASTTIKLSSGLSEEELRESKRRTDRTALAPAS